MNFGTQEGAQTSEADGHRIMDRALELGLNFFDTANMYGGGTTEEIIGRWFAQGDGRREKTVIATKVYGGRDPWPNTNRLSALHIRQACEDSLRRLQTDHIDLYQMHHVDRDTPWDEIWQAMDLLVSQGKVLYVGSSNFAGWHIAKANEAAHVRGSLGLVSEQSLYNLNARTVELEVLPACQDYGLGVIPWSPLGGGILGGALQKVTEGRRGAERMQQQVDKHRPQLEAWEKLCADMGEQPADVALAWLLANPVVTAPIVGPRTIEQLEGDKIFPGPGGAAPEAYAW
jgi:aryl-alcohol dehydrogenase-like predicted oxidoreductase